MLRLELLHIVIDTPFSGLVNFWCLLLACNVDVLFYSRAINRSHVQNELHEFNQSGFRRQDDVFVTNDVDGDLCFEPEVVEVFPDGDLLLDEFGPVVWKFGEVCIGDREVVGARANHVEERCDAVERASNK